jgi:hypothetical protein
MYDPVANDFGMFSSEGGLAVKKYIDGWLAGLWSYDDALKLVAEEHDEVYDTAVREAIYAYVETHPARRDPLSEVW